MDCQTYSHDVYVNMSQFLFMVEPSLRVKVFSLYDFSVGHMISGGVMIMSFDPHLFDFINPRHMHQMVVCVCVCPCSTSSKVGLHYSSPVPTASSHNYISFNLQIFFC